MIRPKTAADLRILEQGGQVLSRALAAVVAAVEPGVTLTALDRIAEKVVRKLGGTPSFKGYEGFPAALCVSVNDAVVHGVPKKNQRLKAGDIVGLDLGVEYEQRFTDAAVTVPVGPVSNEAQKLLQVTREALERGAAAARVGGTIGDIGAAVQTFVASFGFGVVRQLVGHGVGYAVHEEPQVPNYGTAGSGAKLVENLVLAIEPMVTLGGFEVRTAKDGWTVVTADGSLAAHFEYTVVLTPRGAKVLTPLP